ncbi:MAG TPA: hypothetical protein VKP78_02425 [bacterium]|nr:hypothetical protein [bacterium]
MRKKVSIFLVLAITITFLSAQTEQDSTKIFGTHSVQFRVQDCFTLSSFKGGLISYKYHFNDRNALRIGVNNNIDLREIEEDYDVYMMDTSHYEIFSENKDIDISFTIEYLRYFNPDDEIKLFLGGGLKTGYSSYKEENDDDSDITSNYYNRYITGLRTGLTLSYGMEWKFRKNMALHAEYGNDIIWNFYKSKREHHVNPDETDHKDIRTEIQKGIDFYSTGVLLGLSVYF